MFSLRHGSALTFVCRSAVFATTACLFLTGHSVALPLKAEANQTLATVAWSWQMFHPGLPQEDRLQFSPAEEMD